MAEVKHKPNEVNMNRADFRFMGVSSTGHFERTFNQVRTSSSGLVYLSCNESHTPDHTCDYQGSIRFNSSPQPPVIFCIFFQSSGNFNIIHSVHFLSLISCFLHCLERYVPFNTGAIDIQITFFPISNETGSKKG